MSSADVPVSNRQTSATTREVVVYTSRSCHKCTVLKEWLKTSNKEFEERDLENVDVMAELVMRDVVVLSAPVIEVDGVVYTESQIFEGDLLEVSMLKKILEGK